MMIAGVAALFFGNLSAAQADELKPYQNTYCNVQTFIGPDSQKVAMALPLAHTNNIPVIIVGKSALNLPHTGYIMAHECCHHSLKHTSKLPNMHTRESLAQIEQEADQCAANLLQARGEYKAIQAAVIQARHDGQFARAEKITQSLEASSPSGYGFE
ncbi:MAG: hypothetical protein CMM93_01855 [Rickettsiales bacterium]|nr:hypothetical protein [Rickettsiales bacterium]